MATAAATLLSPEEYLALERCAPTRSEYHDGKMVALAGASWNHNVVVDNLSAAINARVSGRSCRAVTSDQKVWSPRTRRFLYPDVVVVCGPPTFHDENRDVIVNPILVIEVLSVSTEAYDRGEKFRHYQSIPSLLEYVLVDQASIQIESYLRQGSEFWRYSRLEPGAEALALTSLSIELPIVEIYRGLSLLNA